MKEERRSIDETGKGHELEMFYANINDFVNSSTRLRIDFIIFETKTDPLFVELSQLSHKEKLED